MSEPETTNRPDVQGSPAPRRLAMPPLVVEHTHWSWGLVGFYVSCAATALGATFAAAGHCFFGSATWLWFGGALSITGAVCMYFTLQAARRPKGRDDAASAPPQ